MSHKRSDSRLLDFLHSHVNSWIKAIQVATKLTRDVSSDTASQGANFWLSLEWALEVQLRSEEVRMVMDSLRNAKRFHATVSFVADTGLKDATDLVHNYNQLMKDLSLNDLPVSSTDLDKVHESKRRLSPYPIRRIIPLVEANSGDCNDVPLRM